jgi:predicted ribosome quality control (RQC) complex YloA/Tae2 family protein
MRKDPNPAAYWHYLLPNDFELKAGKTDVDNDRLTFQEAAASDFWFHVKGVPGSHVILHQQQGNPPDKHTLLQAAAVAAWHSKARNAGCVAVSYAAVHQVSKERGAKAGSVCVKKSKTLKVKPSLPEPCA